MLPQYGTYENATQDLHLKGVVQTAHPPEGQHAFHCAHRVRGTMPSSTLQIF